LDSVGLPRLLPGLEIGGLDEEQAEMKFDFHASYGIIAFLMREGINLSWLMESIQQKSLMTYQRTLRCLAIQWHFASSFTSDKSSGHFVIP